MGRITRTTLVFGGFVTALAVTLYPIAIHPFLNIARFRECCRRTVRTSMGLCVSESVGLCVSESMALCVKVVQKVNRDGVDQESIQPGGMKVWSNPFEPKK
ncbi:unnamed protein product [Lampetra fluviatilis]